jgi:hypothetical protein
VSVFRPAARLTAPDGRTWELYAYRIQLPRRRRHDRGVGLDETSSPGHAASGLLDGLVWLLGGVPRLLVLLLWDAPHAGLRALGSDEWTIEAITWEPHRTAYTWRTTGEFRGHVLAQIGGQLARGETPRPGHATFVGVQG